MNGKIEKIVYPGRRLIRTEGKVVFTDLGLPGETVEYRVIGERKSFVEAATVRVVEPSADRAVPRCSHYRACSPYQEMDYHAEIGVKKAQLEEILARGLRRTPPEFELVPSPIEWNYRNRISLTVSWDDDRPSFAYHEPGETGVLIPVDRCALVPDAVNDLASAFRDMAAAGGWRSLSGLEVRMSRSSRRLLAVLELDDRTDLEAVTAALDGLPAGPVPAGVTASIAGTNRRKSLLLRAPDHLEEQAGGLTFHYGPYSFFQVNIDMLDTVMAEVGRVLAGEPGGLTADMYCGVGVFGLAAAAASTEVLGVETEPENLRFLRKNIALNGVRNFTVCDGPSEEWLEDVLARRPKTVIFDPPRRGLDASMIPALCTAPAGKIVYISCNPSTLVRDLAGLAAVYDLEKIKAYDFFPHTPHIETLAVLRPR